MCMCALTTLDPAALDTPNKVAVLVRDVPAKRTPTICPLWKPDEVSKFEVLSYELLLKNFE